MTTSPSHTTNNNDQQQRLYMPNLGSYKACGCTLGFLVGLFIYLSTLGAEFVAVMLWGKDLLLETTTTTKQDLVWFSLGWNFATTLIAVIILTCLRILVVSVLSSLVAYGRSETNANAISMELLGYLEVRFAIGALVGICLSWNVTNCILGMRPPMIQSCIILAVACLWCRLTILCLQSGSSSGQSNTNNGPLIYSTRMTSKTVTTITSGGGSCNDDDDDDKSKPLLVTV